MADTDTLHSPPLALIEDVRRVLRLHHYSIHTVRAYVEWIVRFVRFHHMQSRADLVPAEAKIEAFLTDLAIRARYLTAPCTAVRRSSGCAGSASHNCAFRRVECAQ